MIRRFWWKCLVLALCWGLGAQEVAAQDKPWSLGVTGHYGFLIPHRTVMQTLVEEHAYALGVFYDRPTNGNKLWQRLYGYPSWGIGFYHSSPGSPDKLGTASGIFPYYRFRFLGHKRVKFYYRLGWGVAYISEPFDQENNFRNVAIGSNINAVISMQGDLQVDLTKQLSWRSGMTFTHFSNGLYQSPNLGINIPTFHTGITWNFGQNDSLNRDPIPDFTPNWQMYLFASAFLKETASPGGPKYGVVTLSAEVGRQLTHKHEIVGGMDVFYNGALRTLMSADSSDVLASPGEVPQVGVKAMYHLNIDKVTILMGGGIYVHTNYTDLGLLYNRVGVRYSFAPRWISMLVLKSHKFKADHIEFGIGHRLWDR